MAICETFDPACLGCQMRAKFSNGLTLPSATPSRSADRKQVVRPMQDPSWEKGIAGEHRVDGSFMPYLNEHREEMGVHEYANRRHQVDGVVRELKSNPDVFQQERVTGTVAVEPYGNTT